MNAPLVSIVIPAFNASSTIAESIESAINQTWERVEVIVVDDGSVDGTAAVAERFSGKGVRVLRRKNSGAAASRNAGVEASAGDYIQWLDADDLLAPDKIERQLRAIDFSHSTRSLLSSEWGSFLHRPAKARYTPSVLWTDLSPRDWLYRKLEHNAYMQTATWLVSRVLVQEAGQWNTSLLSDDDGEYFCRVLLRSSGVVFVDGARTMYRMPGASSLSYLGASDRKLDAMFSSMRLHVSYMLSLDAGAQARLACGRYLERWLPVFEPHRPDIAAQVTSLALECGVVVRPPRASWKVRCLAPLLGMRSARNVELRARTARWEAARKLDRLAGLGDAILRGRGSKGRLTS